MKRFQNRSDVFEFWSLDNSSSKSILDVLETIYLKFPKPIVQRVTVVKFGVYNGGGSYAKQYAIVQNQLNIVTRPTYPQKFTRDNVVAPFVQTSIVIATLPKKFVCKQLAQGYHTVRS